MSYNTLEQNFFDTFRKKLLERIELKTNFVVQGAAEDYANYRERVGEINELRSVLEVLEHTLKAFDPY